MTNRSSRRHNAARAAWLPLILAGIFIPACTNSNGIVPAASPQSPHAAVVVPQVAVAAMTPSTLVQDEIHKSRTAEYAAEPADECSTALYMEEPNASEYTAVSVHEIEEICNQLQIECFRQCFNRAPPKGSGWKKGDGAHYKFCQSKCLAQFMECRKKLGIVTRVFEAFDAAWAWIKEHKTAIVGTIIVVGGVAYIVSTGGSGALILVPLAG